MHLIIYGLSQDYIGIILCIIKPPALGDYVDYVGAFFDQKKRDPLLFESPPIKNLATQYFLREA